MAVRTGFVIRSWRELRGYSVAEVARMTGVSWSGIHAIEKGSNEPSVRVLRKIADALEVPAGSLVDGVLPDFGEPRGPGRSAPA